MPNATESRHAAATAVTKTGEEQEKSAVATLMSHSLETQNRYYAQTKGMEEAVKGFKVMENLRQAPPTTSSGSRVSFSSKDVDTLSLYFDSYIESGEVPPIEECREFLRQHEMARVLWNNPLPQ